jgi:hypothetical protein
MHWLHLSHTFSVRNTSDSRPLDSKDPGYQVKQLNFIIGIHGTIVEHRWRWNLTTLGIERRRQDRIIRKCMTEGAADRIFRIYLFFFWTRYGLLLMGHVWFLGLFMDRSDRIDRWYFGKHSRTNRIRPIF